MATSLLPEERALTTLHTIALAVTTLASSGTDRQLLLDGSGVCCADLDTPDKLITHAQELRVFANALAITRDPSLGLSLGLRMHVSAYGMLGYPMLASRTLRDALTIALGHPALLGTYFKLSLEENDGEACLVAVGYRYAPELTVFNSELCLTSLLTVLQDLLGTSIRPARVCLSYRPPLHAATYEQILGCPAEFGASRNALCFDAALLDRTLPLADPVTCHYGLQQCLKLDAQLNSRHDVLDQIRHHLAGNLRDACDLDSVARQLHRSERTLRRHLQQLNTSFQRLLDEVRYDKARQLLVQTDLPIYLIAEQLGYSETASFRHAFQRWSGQSPSLYRR
ncbi:AraC family transcriptional regulator [Pseudomonas sp. JS3066]|jgi:AraC-like DNA-binding protein|uniref:AraC family transcriptional regulator n=1 Tax=unclassified Pseudomonas TaxID=196821 RepID=UPI000EAA67DE|nr:MULTISPECIES: AraC family transcriptional regulator [unclassified Pseudomonas]AYF89051.1 AraC family transcriptional regulator [Pseudomonas sp. DY-1]MDH4653249.1 AraC family transcriptional regulator [Pseudomonas sp. BN606]MRK21030.1 AraC family transcriptional regulator [Pseudomonas sp. JG-B]WVK93407.1 AraC family transcriptional regulator [Pseudomonas sp. JS3066]